MREFAVSVLVNLRDRLSGGLNGIRRRLEQLRNLGGRLGIDRLGSALGRVVRQVGLVGAAFTTLSTVAGGALITLGNSLAQRGTEIEDLARRAGVATDALQELAFAGNRRGVTMDALVDGLKELQLRADEFILTGEGSAKEAFERLGLSADDLARGLEQPDALFEDIIGRLGQLDRAAQIRIADEIFGGAGGEQFVQLIDMGVEGIRELRQEARDIGAIITPEQLAIMREYRNAVQGLTDRYSGLQNMLAEKLLPVLTPLVDQISAWIDAHRPQVVEAMEKAVSGLADVIPVVVDGFDRFLGIASGIAQGAGKIADQMGGLENIAAGVAAVMSIKLVAALGQLSAVLLTTPAGWFVLAAVGLGMLAKQIYDNWGNLGEWLEGLGAKLGGLAKDTGSAIVKGLGDLGAWAGSVVSDFWATMSARWAAIDWGQLGRMMGKGLVEIVSFAARLTADFWKAVWRAWNDIDWLELGRVLLTGLDAFVKGAGDFVFAAAGAIFEEFRKVDWGSLVVDMKDAIVAGASALVEAGAALIQALWDGIKRKADELLAWFAELPDRIIEAIGSINLSDLISWPEPPGWVKWMFGMESAPTPRAMPGGGESDFDAQAERLGFPAPVPAPTPPVGGPPERRSSLDAPSARSRDFALAAPASAAGAGPRAERQEVAFAGELVVRVDGPGRVTSTQSSDPRVDIQPQRGPSLALA